MSPLLEDRVAKLSGRPLLKGSHASPAKGLCAMEAVAWVAGEKHSDQPACACPVIGAFFRSWNDAIPDDEKRTQLLMPFVVRLVGSKSTTAVEQRRADLALDWLVRYHAATWLEKSESLKEHAAAIRALPPLLSKDALLAAQPTLTAAAQQAAAARAAARAAAWDAAWDAARAAAWDAAWDAARAAAWDAARAAARAAAWDAAWDAARAAAWDAARAAAWDAAWAAYQNVVTSGGDETAASSAAYDACVASYAATRDTLERSALELIDRMLAVTPESLAAEGERVS